MEENLPIEQPGEPPGESGHHDIGQPDQAEAASPGIVSDRDCAGCGAPATEEKHSTPLCADCRQKFIRYPIPVWIRVFAAGIGALVLFSLFTFPKDLSLGIGLEKGERAEKEKKYITAQREMEQAVKKAPGNVEAEGHLLIDAYYNQDMQTLARQFKKLKDTRIEDKQLMASIEEILDKLPGYYGNDSFSNFTTSHPDWYKVSDADWAAYMDRNPRDVSALIIRASLFFGRKEFPRCDSCLQDILRIDPGFYPALEMISSLKRQEKKPDSALLYNERLLSINKEFPYGIASKARTLLMQKKDKEALDLALKGYAFKKDDAFVQATLILAYHFNQQMKDRDDLIKTARQAFADSVDKGNLQYALDVVDNKEKFRD